MSGEASGRIMNLIGTLKLATLGVGVLTLGLAADSYKHDSDAQKYFLSIVIIAFILSLFFVIAIVAGLLEITDLWKKIDMGFHVLMAALLLIGAIAFMSSLIKFRKDFDSSKKAKQAFALIFGYLNSILYGYIGFAVFKTE